MKLKARPFNFALDEHLFRSLAELRGEKIPKEIFGLPPTGLVVTNHGRPVCVGFLIKCDNGMGVFSDFLSDPRADKEVRNAAAELMREVFYSEAERCGLKFVTSFTKHPKLAKRLEGLGFMKMDEGFTQMGRFLWL